MRICGEWLVDDGLIYHRNGGDWMDAEHRQNIRRTSAELELDGEAWNLEAIREYTNTGTGNTVIRIDSPFQASFLFLFFSSTGEGDGQRKLRQ